MGGEIHDFVLACVSTYLLHLELTFTPHYIITDKGLLKLWVAQTFCVVSGTSCEGLACKTSNPSWILSESEAKVPKS